MTRILTYFLQTDKFISSSLATGKNLYLGIVENRRVIFYSGTGKNQSFKIDEIEASEISPPAPLIIMLTTRQYQKREFKLSKEDFIDLDTWIDLHIKEIIPPGLHKNFFELFTQYDKRRGIFSIFLLSKTIITILKDAAGDIPYHLYLSERQQNINPQNFFEELLLNLPGGIWLGQVNQQSHPAMSHIKQWLLLLVAGISGIILLFISGQTLFSHFMENRQNELSGYGIQKEEHIILERQIKKEQKKIFAYRSFQVNQNNCAEKIHQTLLLIPDEAWVESLRQEGKKITINLFFTELKSLTKYQASLRELSFLKDVKTNLIISANPNRMKNKYKIDAKVYRVELSFSWL